MDLSPKLTSLAALACLLALLLPVLATDSAAQVSRRPFGLIMACSEDARRLCPGVLPGGGRIVVCLNAQAEKLSQPCFQALAERGLAFAAALRLCRPDYERLCPDTPPGQGRALACLLDNRSQISAECSDALSAHGFDDDAPPPPR